MRLLDQVRAAIRVRHYSAKTEEAYVVLETVQLAKIFRLAARVIAK